MEVFLPDGIVPDGWALAFFLGFMLGAIAMYFTGGILPQGKITTASASQTSIPRYLTVLSILV